MVLVWGSRCDKVVSVSHKVKTVLAKKEKNGRGEVEGAERKGEGRKKKKSSSFWLIKRL
jgi:hypothetical protein